MPNPVRQKCIAGLREGDVFTFERTFTHEETLQFGELTRDYNPVHYERGWTDAKGFGGPICHGLLVGSMICEFGGQVGWLATGMNFKFIAPVYFGDTITCTLTLTRIENSGRAEAEAVMANTAGRAVCLAQLTGRLPLDAERDLLGRIVGEGDRRNGLRTCQRYRISRQDTETSDSGESENPIETQKAISPHKKSGSPAKPPKLPG